MILFDIIHKRVNDLHCDLVYPVVIISVLGKISLHFVVHCNSVFIPDGTYFGIFDGGEGICHYRKAGNAGGKPAGYIHVIGELYPYFPAASIIFMPPLCISTAARDIFLLRIYSDKGTPAI